MTKSEIRRDVLACLKGLSGKEERSRILQEKFLSLPQVTAASCVALFMSMPTEPDTTGCIAALQKMGKKVYVPRVCGEEMVFVEITEKAEFIPGTFGVKEPLGKPYQGPFDVIAVPLVAFDDNNYRLGHGKGYYDRYLNRYPSFSVGLAFAEQKKDVPVDPWDVPLSVILYV